MKYLLWFFTGICMIGISFFLGYNKFDVWNSVFAGAAGGALFLVLFFSLEVRKSFTKKESISLGIVFFSIIIGFAMLSWIHYRMATYQRQTLSTIRTVVGEGIIISEKIHTPMIAVLRKYYDQTDPKKKSVVTLFNETYADSISNGLIRLEQEYSLHTMNYISYKADSVVQFIVVDTVAKGWKESFKNNSGHYGKLQFNALLSKHGVSYERIN